MRQDEHDTQAHQERAQNPEHNHQFVLRWSRFRQVVLFNAISGVLFNDTSLQEFGYFPA